MKQCGLVDWGEEGVVGRDSPPTVVLWALHGEHLCQRVENQGKNGIPKSNGRPAPTHGMVCCVGLLFLGSFK